MKFTQFILIGLLAILVNGCSSRQEAVPVPPVAVTTVQPETLSYVPEMHFSGTVRASKEANLGAALPGRIEKIHFAEGERVNQADVLCELSAELMTQTDIKYRTLEKDFERVTRLREKHSIPEQQYDHVKAEFEAAQAMHELMKKNTQIRAPFDGTVTDHLLNEGEVFTFYPSLDPGVSHASGIIRLMQLDPVKIEIEVNQNDLAAIQVGQTAVLLCDAYPDRAFTGRVARIKERLDPSTRAAQTQILVENPDRVLKPGMFCHVTLKFPEKTAIFIPRFSVSHQPGTGEKFVYVVRQSIAHRQLVDPQVIVNDRISVSGVEGGDTVVLGGKSKLVDGARVRTTDEVTQ